MKKATLAQAVQVLDLLREKRVPAERLQALLASGFLADLCDLDEEEIRELGRTTLQFALGFPLKCHHSFVFPAYLSGDDTFEEQKARGDYWSFSRYVSPETFPVLPQWQEVSEQLSQIGNYVNFLLIKADKGLTGIDAFRDMVKMLQHMQHRPATLMELMAIGAEHTDSITNFRLPADGQVVALGSQREKSYAPMLHAEWADAGRRLSLVAVENDARALNGTWLAAVPLHMKAVSDSDQPRKKRGRIVANQSNVQENSNA